MAFLHEELDEMIAILDPDDEDDEQDEAAWAAMCRRGSQLLLKAILAYQAKRGPLP